MTGKTHTAIGMAIGLTLAFKKPIEAQLAIITASTLGALIPDLDHPKGELNQKLLLINNNFFKTAFYLIVGLIFIYLYIEKNSPLFLLIGLFSFSLAISRHRSFTHSILGLILFAAIIKLTMMEYGLSSIGKGFIVGYISHLVLDLFTSKGIRLFYPMKKNIAFPIKFKSNGLGEKIIFSLLILYCLVVLLLNFLLPNYPL